MSAIEALIFDYGRTLYDPGNITLFPDAGATIAALASKYRLAIVSLVSGDDHEERTAARIAMLQHHQLDTYFSAILFGPANKERLYQQTLERLSLPASQVAIVDDRMIRGIAWGNKQGATTVWFRNGKFRDELPTVETGQPTYTIHHLTELLDIFLS